MAQPAPQELVPTPAALVLSGGAALGEAHVGILKVIAPHYRFDYFCGVSAGAIVAACLACGQSVSELVKMIESAPVFRLLFDFLSAGSAILKGKKVYTFFQRLYGDRAFADLRCPLVIGTTDFQNGERVMVSSGLIADAVRASVSLPVIFSPVYHPVLKRWLVDGGLTQNLPLEQAINSYQGGSILAIDVATSLDEQATFEPQKGRRLIETATRAFRIVLRSQKLPSDPRVAFIRPDLTRYSAASVRKLKEIMRGGEKAGNEFLAKRMPP